MRKYKNKIKKILYKTIPCIVVFSLLFSFSLIPNAAEIIQTGTSVYYNLDELFDGASDDFIYTIADGGGMPSGLRSDSGYFRSKVLFPGGVATIQGDLNLIPGMFSTELYYKFSIPLSICVGGLSVSTVRLSFIDNDGTEHVFSQEFLRPDPLNTAYVTVINELVLSGKQLQSVNKFKLSVYGSGWESSGYPRVYLYCGLLNGRSFSISSITQYQYDSLYGGSTAPIVPDAENNIAHFESVEDELLSSANVFGVLSFFENMENFELFTPLHASSMLFSELYNFGGTRTTIFESIAIFSLALGLVVLLLAIAPRLVGGGKKK